MNFNLDEWVEELTKLEEPQTGGLYTDEFLQAQIDPVVVAAPQSGDDRRWVSFSICDLGTSGAVDAAVQFLAERGETPYEQKQKGRNIWRTAIRVKKFLRTYVDRDTSGWDLKKECREELYVPRQDRMPDGWRPANFSAVAEALYKKDEAGNDVSPLQGRWGKPLWVHIRRIVDKTFVYNNPETHTQYNTRTYTDDKGEEHTVARRIDLLVAAFDEKNELLAYMKEKGVDVVNADTDAPVMIMPPEGWLQEMQSSFQDWEKYIKDIADEVATSVSGTPIPKRKIMVEKAIAKSAETWGLPEEVVREIVSAYPPF